MSLRDSACVEGLEARQLLSVTLEDGILRVVGTDGNDYLLVRQEGNTVRLEHRVNTTGRPRWFHDDVVEAREFTLGPETPLLRVVVHGLKGDDAIDLYRPKPAKTGAKNWPWVLNQALQGSVSADARLVGGAGDDEITSGAGFAKVSAGRGVDRVTVGGGSGTDGVAGNVVDLGSGDDYFQGGGGNDTVYGRGGRDLIHGGGYAGADRLSGGAGDDFFRIGSDDRAFGGKGNDTFEVCTTDATQDIVGDAIEAVWECERQRGDAWPHPRDEPW